VKGNQSIVGKESRRPGKVPKGKPGFPEYMQPYKHLLNSKYELTPALSVISIVVVIT
jgi:hypothetical protein